MRFIIFLPIFVALAASFDLKCHSEITGYGFLPYLNYCQVDSLVITHPNREITSVNGVESPTTFQGINFQNLPLLYLPKGLGKFFPQLKALRVFSCGLKTIKAADLEGLTKLEHLIIHSNAIEELDSDLFKFTPKINDIYVRDNPISRVGKDLLAKLNSLRRIDFLENQTESRRFFEILIVEKCKYFIDEVCEDDFNKYKREIASLKAGHNNEVASLKSRHTKEAGTLRNEISSLKNSVAYKTNEISSLKANLASKSNEVASVKSRYEKEIGSLKASVASKTNEVASAKSKYEKEIASLKAGNQKEVASLKANHEKQIASLKVDHGSEISSLNSKHESEVESLKATDVDKTSEIASLKESLASKTDEVTLVESKCETEITTLKAENAEKEAELGKEISELKEGITQKCTVPLTCSVMIGDQIIETECRAKNLTIIYKGLTLSTKNVKNAEAIEVLTIEDQKTYAIPTDLSETFPKLIRLVIVNSQLKFLNRNDFKGMNSLEEIKIEQNNIRRIEEGVFNEVPQLIRLSLANNKIESLPPTAFAMLTNLKSLVLNLNKLKEISVTLLPRNNVIEEFQMQYNQLHTIEPQLLDLLENAELIDFTGNLCINMKYEKSKDESARSGISLQDMFEHIEQQCFGADKREETLIKNEIGGN